jgi:hypothetical protein
MYMHIHTRKHTCKAALANNMLKALSDACICIYTHIRTHVYAYSHTYTHV